MNPKLQESGRKGGTAGKGASKVRPLSPSKASEMARSRWAKVKPAAPVFYDGPIHKQIHDFTDQD